MKAFAGFDRNGLQDNIEKRLVILYNRLAAMRTVFVQNQVMVGGEEPVEKGSDDAEMRDVEELAGREEVSTPIAVEATMEEGSVEQAAEEYTPEADALSERPSVSKIAPFLVSYADFQF
jgi:hypothetical protein